MDWSVRRASRVSTARDVELELPGDKSISHRAVILASIAEGTSRIEGFLNGEDTRATVRIMRQLGVRIIEGSPTSLEIHGVGLHGLKKPAEELDCGNAGTGMRLLAGLLSGQGFDATLTGDASLRQRPMQRIISPLRLMGAQIESSAGGLPPLVIRGHASLRAIAYTPDVASAQVKSAVLLAGLYAMGETTVNEIAPTRNYTEQMLAQMGWPMTFDAGYARIEGRAKLHAMDFDVPGDFSSAAFVIVAAILSADLCVTVRNVGISPSRVGLLKALKLMGANIAVLNERDTYAGVVADIRAEASTLTAIDLPREWVVDMIDEIPVLLVAAARATGTSRVRGAQELRVKESDRLSAMASNLRKLGVPLTELDDGIDVVGGCPLHGANLQAFDDHRIAMSLAVLASQLDSESSIAGVDNVATSFPDFTQTMAKLGYAINPR